MKEIKYIIWFLLVLPFIGHSQVSFKIHLDKKEIGFFDPIELDVTLSYTGPDTMFFSVFSTNLQYDIDSMWRLSNRPAFQYKHVDSMEWKSILNSVYPRYTENRVRSARHREKISSKLFTDRIKRLIYFPVSDDGNYLFQRPGAYLVRLSVSSFYSEFSGIVSSVDTIYVKKYCRADKRIIKRLQKVDNPRFVFSYLTHSVYGLSMEREPYLILADEILGWNSKSKYADLAKWHIVNTLIARKYTYCRDGYSFVRLFKMQMDILAKTHFPEILGEFSKSSLEGAKEDDVIYDDFFSRGKIKN